MIHIVIGTLLSLLCSIFIHYDTSTTYLQISDFLHSRHDSFITFPELDKSLCKASGVILKGKRQVRHEHRLSRKLRTSWTMWPTFASTTSWNFPCICPIMSSLSNRSVPANTSKRAVLAVKNLPERPVNQPERHQSLGS